MGTSFLSRCVAPVVVTLLVLCAMDTCLAQGGVYRGGYGRSYGGRYRSPYGPTISPYLDYFRRDSGALDPYNAFIRPRRQLQQELGDIVQQEFADNARLERQIQGIRAATAAPTGTGATFLNYSHYYPTGGGAARR